ncbi:RNA-binding protein [Mesorhizobium sp.]|uniref:RNA-binding protein n=1 Tax=Mesorhizobium sp. TaxID=1871066 RepID=UPI0025FC77E2|nr:RNA-binding protein [Mesorhizobium sp.]
MPFAKYSSIFTPADLEIIQRVFDQLCIERRLALKDGDQRKMLAAEVMEAFENGFTDETALWQSLSKRRTARA